MPKSKPSVPPQQAFPCDPPDVQPIIRQMLQVRSDLIKREAAYPHFKNIHPAHLPSARNLLHYLAFRLHDLRELQLLLSEWGLSSLGRAERKVQATVDTVLAVLHKLAGQPFLPKEQPPVCYREGRRKLEANAAALFGEQPAGRRVRIMVTMPPEAAHSPDLVKNLLRSGMNCARINCAHDGGQAWRRMVENIRWAEKDLGQPCQILMDLGGPKLRTGELPPGPAVLRIRPRRNELGAVEQPALIWLHPPDSREEKPAEAAASLVLPQDWLERCQPGDRIKITDARGSRRRWKITAAPPGGCFAEAEKTT